MKNTVTIDLDLYNELINKKKRCSNKCKELSKIIQDKDNEKTVTENYIKNIKKALILLEDNFDSALGINRREENLNLRKEISLLKNQLNNCNIQLLELEDIRLKERSYYQNRFNNMTVWEFLRMKRY